MTRPLNHYRAVQAYHAGKRERTMTELRHSLELVASRLLGLLDRRAARRRAGV